MFIFGFGMINVVAAIALAYLPGFARLARNMTMLVKGEPYVQAAKLAGQSSIAIMLLEILPNISGPLLVRLTLGFAFGVVIEAGLSFLGLGIQPPTSSLGVIMADAKEYFARAPWVLTLTGLTVCFILLGLNLFGDGLRDLLDPRLRHRLGRLSEMTLEVRGLCTSIGKPPRALLVPRSRRPHGRARRGSRP